MVGNVFENRNVDIVFCIDCTGGMRAFVENLKYGAYGFLEDIVRAMFDLDKDIETLRVKAIVFRDYCHDGGQAMVESPFFNIPEDKEEYEKFIMEIRAEGGGDYPENGLEALYYAMKSDFTATGAYDRQAIVLFTDADALKLKARADAPDYPADMVDGDGLAKLWAEKNDRNKRLIIFAPEDTEYQTLKFNRCAFFPVQACGGISEMELKDIAKIIAKYTFVAI